MHLKLKLLNTYILSLLIHWASGQYPYGGGTSYTNENIPIGLITDQNTEEMGIIFDHAIDMANPELELQLTSIKDEVNYGDAFQGYGRLCRMLERGVGGIFGPSSRNTVNHLMTVCDEKDIPYFFSHLSENSEGFNLHPHPLDLAKALHSIISAFEWSRFIFLYESTEYLSILNGLMSIYGNNGPIISVLRYDLHLNGNYKTVLRRVRQSVDNRIVVVGSTESMPEFLKQAQQIGIFNEDYKYIIGNLDFHSFDLEEYKFSEANVTSLRMFSPEQSQVREIMSKFGYTNIEDNFRNGSCPITLELALTYDAVQLFAETTKHLPFQPIALNCSDRSNSVRDDGSTFKNYMRSLNLTRNTLTGHIYFEGNIRKGYTFDVIELQPSGIVKVGTWDEVNNYIPQRMAKTTSLFDNLDNSLANKTFTVLLSVPNKPYANLVESHEKLEGNSQYEGYSIDLIKELAGKLGFTYILKNGGTDYGSYNSTTNSTSGMLKEIIEFRGDLVVTDLTITSEREEIVDFSTPFMNLGIAILHLKPKKAPPAFFSFMDPFSKEVWLYLGLSFVGVSLSLFILGRLSPTEWDNPFPCLEDPTELHNQFTLGNSFWYTTGALLQQGSDIAPKAFSTRTVAAIWCFFTLILVSYYTANLASFLTFESPRSLINNVDDLAENKGGVKFGARESGSTRNFFLTSSDKRYKKMSEFMNKYPQYLTDSNEKGVERVISNTDYAFLMESTSIDYYVMRKCNLKKIGDALDEKGYGIAMRKNWPYRQKFNNAMLELQEQGVLAKMKNKWWNEVGAGICTSKTESSEASPLDMDNLYGVYCVLVVGSCFSLLYGIITWILFVITKATRYQVSLKDAFIEEIKFIADFNTNTRVLKSSASVYSRSRNSSMTIDSIDPDTNTIDS